MRDTSGIMSTISVFIFVIFALFLNQIWSLCVDELTAMNEAKRNRRVSGVFGMSEGCSKLVWKDGSSFRRCASDSSFL